MELTRHTFAEAIYRTTRLVLRKDQLNAKDKADSLHHLLCLMVKRLPQDWGTDTRKVLEVKDCKPDALLMALDSDLRHTGFEPEQYAIFGALRQLILTIKDLREEEVREPVSQPIVSNAGLSGGGYTSAGAA